MRLSTLHFGNIVGVNIRLRQPGFEAVVSSRPMSHASFMTVLENGFLILSSLITNNKVGFNILIIHHFHFFISLYFCSLLLKQMTMNL